MRILIAYASKHGATGGIAERLGHRLADRGHHVEVVPVWSTGDLREFDAFVVGSATYLGHWRREATDWVRRHHVVLADHPVFFFSSGPLGGDRTDASGRDLRTVSEPREMPELVAAVHPRDHHVFFGRLDPEALTAPERLIRRTPAGHQMLPSGDFRDWADVDEWAALIDDQLVPA
ncbi:flavodoxin domain-containing protein [Nocardioides ferulae]|uniref:flavodoxin domain-containing protein n=1 Tax=Nocardioides ferulae TaxID=2340821 RepID=UPI000EB39AF4|nr:flavodoxin domain-containing protein [Nocardioides ferulae]